MHLLGIDLAWQTNKNPSALTVGVLFERQLSIEQIEPSLVGLHSITNFIDSQQEITGIAIDAPLIIPNQSGQRSCETELSKDYASRKAACHPTNLNLIPDALSVQLSKYLRSLDFQHLGKEKWQFECYPHPSMIECFGLSERLLYKKGTVSDKKAGQIKFADFLKDLVFSEVLSLQIASDWRHHLDENYIKDLKGQALKTNEDTLDSIMCVYIAGLYALNIDSVTYGCIEKGYIWVPRVQCIKKDRL